jgi:hypothetical protein
MTWASPGNRPGKTGRLNVDATTIGMLGSPSPFGSSSETEAAPMTAGAFPLIYSSRMATTVALRDGREICCMRHPSRCSSNSSVTRSVKFTCSCRLRALFLDNGSLLDATV